MALKDLQTQSGKVEEQRPAIGPQYIESWEGHHAEALAKRYPLRLNTPHPHFRCDSCPVKVEPWAADR